MNNEIGGVSANMRIKWSWKWFPPLRTCKIYQVITVSIPCHPLSYYAFWREVWFTAPFTRSCGNHTGIGSPLRHPPDPMAWKEGEARKKTLQWSPMLFWGRSNLSVLLGLPCIEQTVFESRVKKNRCCRVEHVGASGKEFHRDRSSRGLILNSKGPAGVLKSQC